MCLPFELTRFSGRKNFLTLQLAEFNCVTNGIRALGEGTPLPRHVIFFVCFFLYPDSDPDDSEFSGI